MESVLPARGGNEEGDEYEGVDFHVLLKCAQLDTQAHSAAQLWLRANVALPLDADTEPPVGVGSARLPPPQCRGNRLIDAVTSGNCSSPSSSSEAFDELMLLCQRLNAASNSFMLSDIRRFVRLVERFLANSVDDSIDRKHYHLYDAATASRHAQLIAAFSGVIRRFMDLFHSIQAHQPQTPESTILRRDLDAVLLSLWHLTCGLAKSMPVTNNGGPTPQHSNVSSSSSAPRLDFDSIPVAALATILVNCFEKSLADGGAVHCNNDPCSSTGTFNTTR